MDVLYRVKGPCEPELRYSLRSLINVEHGRVWLVGEGPAWLRDVEVIRTRRRWKWRGLLYDLFTACQQLGDRDVLLMDDDFYLLRPADCEPMYRGPLADHAQEAKGAYSRSLAATDTYLREKGIPAPLSYDLHVPLPINTALMATLLEPVLAFREPLQARSLYGNLAGVGGRQVPDVKVAPAQETPATGYLSSKAGKFPLVADLLASLFPAPCRYEGAT